MNNTEVQRALHRLNHARLIASYVEDLDAGIQTLERRPTCGHLGALLADSILQSGLSYKSVVRPRITRILGLYPQAESMHGILNFVQSDNVGVFLDWKGAEKIERFKRIVAHLWRTEVESVADLSAYLMTPLARSEMMQLSGIGNKTFDYMACLAGIDCIPVDRHVLNFTASIGIEVYGYEETQAVVSYAADLLGIKRRDFDAWLWEMMSSSHQLQLL